MIYGYIRVSTDRQTTENQQFEIINFAQKNDIEINKWIQETISSTKDLDKRKLGKLLKNLRSGDIIIASELSRLGRNLLQVMSILHHCMNKDVQVWTIKDNYRLGTDITSKVLAFAFGLSAEIERNLISQRTKEALNRLKSQGIKLGRPSGSKNKTNALASQKNAILSLLNKKVSKTKIAKMMGVSRITLYRFLKEYQNNGHYFDTIVFRII